MTKNDYTELDKLILASVKKGNNRFMKIQAGIPRDARLVVWNDRIIDRRLQALHKQKKLTFVAKTGWTIPVKEKQATTRVVTEGML